MNKKLILFMTSLSLAVTPIGAYAGEYTGQPASIEAVEDRANLKAATGEYRTWKQYDSRWGSMKMAPGYDTMAQSGCLVAAIATLMVHSGASDESGVDPGKLCTYLSNNGGFTSNSELYWGKVNGAVEGFSLANWSVSLSGSRYDKAAQIERYLNQGYYIVVSVGHGEHWVAVDSADGNGNINIFDPGYSYKKLFGSYSDSGVTRIALFSSNGSGNGSIGGGGSENNNNNTTVENYSAKGKVNVGASYLNVRTGIGTDKAYLKDSAGNQITLRNGEEVTITGKGKDGSGNTWYRIALNGVTGYVYGAYIQIIENSDNNNPAERIPGKVNAAAVNIRSGAGTHYTVITVARQNEGVTILGEEKDGQGQLWYKVDYKGTVGFINSEYVTKDSDGGNDNSSNYPEKDAKVNASAVNVRSGAGTNYGIVKTLGLNTKIKVIGEAKDGSGAAWYKIKFDGGEGYMHSDYVTINDNGGDNNNGGAVPEQKRGTVNDDYVNVRTGAGTNHSRVTSLNSGTAVTIVGEEKDGSGAVWYKIKFANGEGYMHSDYITVSGGNNGGNNNNGGYEKKSGKVNANSVNVRSGAGTNHGIVGNLSSGTEVTIIGEEKDGSGSVWYKIEYNGVSGYMISDFITVGGSDGGGSGSTPAPPTTDVVGHEGVINAARVNIRTGAGSNYDVMNVLKSGVSVLIEGVETDGSGVVWYKVAFAGTSGYMMAEYVSVQ